MVKYQELLRRNQEIISVTPCPGRLIIDDAEKPKNTQPFLCVIMKSSTFPNRFGLWYNSLVKNCISKNIGLDYGEEVTFSLLFSNGEEEVIIEPADSFFTFFFHSYAEAGL
jgi:hypothetical protein